MCGIVGFISKDNNKKEIIQQMMNKIVHRGPDQEGYYIDEKIALGHQRLSIIDLEQGNQPMISNNGKLIIIFNGEIYNFKELKEELKEKGYEFYTNSDTEVLLQAYKEWGTKMPKKLRGMFAFAIWDKENETLFCARDNFGMKPLYYYQKEGIFMFASEIKSLLKHPQFEKSLNKKMIGPYLSFGFVPTTQTFFKQVFQLEPGTILIVKKNNIVKEKYYDIKFKEKQEDFNEVVQKIQQVIKDSVEHHLISDVKIGSFLSSGVDSSYIVSLAKPDKTYTVGYDIEKYSEINYAKDLTDKLGISNISKKITKEEYMEVIPKVLYYMDEPSADPAIAALYLVCKLASKDVKVVLSGEGADEFFGGYNYYREEIDMQFYNKIPFVIRKALSTCFRILPEFKGRNFIVRRGRKLEEEYVGVNKIFSEEERKKVLTFKDIITNQEIIKPLLSQYSKQSNLVKRQVIDIKYWFVKDILQKVDRMTMANSIEGRIPFVDIEVFKIASQLPTNYKIAKANTKIALRQAAKQEIPNKSYEKKKLGFPVPLREWMKQKDIYEEIKNTINQEFVAEFFNQKYALKLLEQHKYDKKDNYKKIWAIYCFIKWYEIFFLENNI